MIFLRCCKFNAAGHRLHQILQNPSGNHRIEAEDTHRCEYAHEPGYIPFSFRRQLAVGTEDIAPCASAHNELSTNHRHAYNKDEQEIT